MNKREEFIKWIQNVHALEIDISKTLESQIDDFASYSEVQNKVKEHLAVTKRQAEDLKSCLKQLGSDISSVKSILGSIKGTMSGIMMESMPDKVIKNSIANHAIENLEIASYEALLAAAKEIGENEVTKVFENNLKEEEAMAAWLKDNLPRVVKQYLSA